MTRRWGAASLTAAAIIAGLIWVLHPGEPALQPATQPHETVDAIEADAGPIAPSVVVSEHEQSSDAGEIDAGTSNGFEILVTVEDDTHVSVADEFEITAEQLDGPNRKHWIPSYAPDSKPRFLPEKMTPGRWRLIARGPPKLFEVGETVVDISGPDAEPIVIAVHKKPAPPPHHLLIHVVDSHGKPIPKAKVRGEFANHESFASADEHGDLYAEIDGNADQPTEYTVYPADEDDWRTVSGTTFDDHVTVTIPDFASLRVRIHGVVEPGDHIQLHSNCDLHAFLVTSNDVLIPNRPPCERTTVCVEFGGGYAKGCDVVTLTSNTETVASIIVGELGLLRGKLDVQGSYRRTYVSVDGVFRLERGTFDETPVEQFEIKVPPGNHVLLVAFDDDWEHPFERRFTLASGQTVDLGTLVVKVPPKL